MSDDLRRAFATLELPFGSSRAAVARRYKVLVKRWHPDKFTGDPQGVVDATQRLRAINVAHDTIKAHWQTAPVQEASANRRSRTDASPRPSDARAYAFTREQIEEIVAAMRYREGLWERLQDDPWNRTLSLLLAFGHLVWSLWIWFAVAPKDGGMVVVLSVVMSGGLLPYVWSDQPGRKVLGWFWLVFFAVLLVVLRVADR